MDRKHVELIQILNSLKHSVDGAHLHLQSKDKQLAKSRRLFQKLEDKLSGKRVKYEESVNTTASRALLFALLGGTITKNMKLSVCVSGTSKIVSLTSKFLP